MYIFLLLLTVLITACSTDDDASGDDDDSDTTTADVNYVLTLRALDDNGESADYFLTVEDIMSGEISAVGNGAELAGWNYAANFGGKYFAFSYEENICTAYELEDGELAAQDQFAFTRIDVMNPLNDDYFIGIGAPWGGGSYDCQLQLINIEDVAIDLTVDDPIYESYVYVDSLGENVQLNAWPTDTYFDGSNVYVSFYPLHGTTWVTPNTDTAYVSVFTYPDFAYVKTFKDSRTGPIGYYGDQPVLLENESGDHYALASSSYAAGFTQSTKPSGILKINSGEMEFDEDYFFNIEDLGYRVMSGKYVSDGLAVVSVIPIEADEDPSASWASFSVTTPLLYTAIVDLENQTFTIVEDVPAHGGQYKTPYLVQDGKVYISVHDGTEAYVYEVDPTAGTATQGALLEGTEFQALFAVD